MRLRLELCDLSLASLDGLEVDTLAAFVGSERPLVGLPALLDWRLAGAVSRSILDGTVTPEHGEALLLPTGGRLLAGRVLVFGLSDPSPRTVALAVRHACEALRRAGGKAVGISLPAGGSQAAAARAWVEASASAGFARQVLLCDIRGPLAPTLEAAARDLGVAADVVRVAARAESPTG
ncbi:MAG: M17 family peptidase N-terminal domain-containing protein [Deltaproteobacteria bacterium]